MRVFGWMILTALLVAALLLGYPHLSTIDDLERYMHEVEQRN